MRPCSVLALALMSVSGCGEGASSPTTGGGHGGEMHASTGSGATGSGGAAGGGAEGQIPIAVTCVADSEPTYDPYSNDVPQVPLCESPDTLPRPTRAVLIDLTDTVPGAPGTCGPFASFDEEARPVDPGLGFPQVLRLPAVNGVDPGCLDVCADQATAFGLTVFYPDLGLLVEDRLLVLRVPAPWFLVVGDEHSPVPCLDGSPSILEYGKPLACAATWGNHLGFATADPKAPSADVLVDLVDTGALPSTPMCCPFMCP